jgi:hypothetical protein
MKEIQLTQGRVAIVDDEDYDIVNKYNWWAVQGGDIHKVYYAQKWLCRVKGVKKYEMLHNFIAGRPGYKLFIDHINGDGLDNRKENLRIVTNRQNGHNNSGQSNRLGRYKGVYLNRTGKKFVARITVDYKQLCLGSYQNETDAAIAYNNAAIKYFGEFARLNEIPNELKNGTNND